MTISLYDATVPGYLQILGAVEKVLERGAAHAREHGIDPAELVEARLYFDMLPLRFQIVSISHHSRGAIEGAGRGLFEPPESSQSYDYAGLQALIAETRQALEKIAPDAVNALEGKDMVFQLGDRRLPFFAGDFLLSFSLPNFYFHATTAYDILRTKGVSLGKRDFIGRLRLKT
ncbi:DUF1993 family protein [Bradyrhizobium sp. WD16]|uniref:DUF1993 domain-containing protein n=1 Tax=Bradyrhizobium sp. WD16 TaxID=1521768 RepID=UPI0020A50387|nr:DUF1993 domain-containing protein [Bradyrhizobium sp. WD16]UTD28191.1 DUF1993 domain-containing protein [Bradyrhizobium sp. WD16]